MRCLKFRAWIKTAKQMIENNQIMHIEFKEKDSWMGFWFADEDEDGPCQRLADLKLSDLELMQFTGLKDKNGKEIYEGDIVKDEKDKGVVYFCSPSFVAIDKNREQWLLGAGYSYPQGKNTLEKTEVIGNIYENPELLKEA